MSRPEALRLLKVASEQVPCGIYALVKGDYFELRNDRLSVTKTKEMRRAYRAQGMKVYANGI